MIEDKFTTDLTFLPGRKVDHTDKTNQTVRKFHGFKHFDIKNLCGLW